MLTKSLSEVNELQITVGKRLFLLLARIFSK